ncbi:hypothetical protein [Intrasporangium sp. YIM S08009]|uniref:hypothetical protein n=1 Tax=Intrasporangium zincisolvens TaxID=3080018 RepID=UPI002B05700A|nr:hypothetical protein [Intrasporangium sp. YIM S08009]
MVGHEPDHGRSDAETALDVARYRYLLRVASPHVFELVHVEVFTQLPEETRETLFRRLRRDLPEEQIPVGPEPEELARAAAWAQDGDPAYLLRMFRRPAEASDAEATEPDASAGRRRPGATTYAGSVLEAVARTAAGSEAAAETLLGFDTSVEAAQVDPTFYTPRSPTPTDPEPPIPRGW